MIVTEYFQPSVPCLLLPLRTDNQNGFLNKEDTRCILNISLFGWPTAKDIGSSATERGR